MAYLGTKPANQVIDSTLIADGTVTPADLSTGKPVWDTSGNVGIGTSSPTAKLSFGTYTDTTATDVKTIRLYDDGVNGVIYGFGVSTAQLNYRCGTSTDSHVWYAGTTERMRLSSSRLNLIGTGSRGATGNVVTTPNDSVASLVRQSGYIEIVTDVGAVGVNYFLSDERKKENIEPCVKTSSDLIKDINFIQFDWKEGSGNSGHVDVGVSAQQLQSLDNRLVNELSDGSFMVNEPALVTHLAKAIQEQQAIIQSQADTISAMEARLTALESK